MEEKIAEVQQIEDGLRTDRDRTITMDNDPVVKASSQDNTHLENGLTEKLTPEHREYLIARHGTVDLNPLPSMDPADPLNWASWKKNVNLLLISFHAMMTTFIAAGIIPAFEQLSIDLDVSLTKASYLVSIFILILGFAPLFWKPVSNRFGRRPIWLISTICSMVCNIGNARSHNYASQAITRILVAFFISPAGAISSAVVTETFFARERGQKMGIWTLMVTLGPATGPFIMGFVAYYTNTWTWIYYIFAITNGVQFILYFFFSPETLYIRSAPVPTSTLSPFRREYLNFGKIGPNPLTLRDFWTPIRMFAYPNVMIPTVAYSIVFGFASVLLTVEIPQIFTPKFGFNAQQIGLQFIGLIIGSVLGEQVGGRGSDWFISYQRRKMPHYQSPPAEIRLWLSYFGYLCVLVGLIIFCVRLDEMKAYDVSPIVGIAIAGFGNQLITTVLVTYAVDCWHEHAGSIGVFVNLVRSTWGFIGPFWFPDMFTNTGLSGSAGIMIGIVVVVSIIPTLFIQWKGGKIRVKGHEKEAQLKVANTITR